jgi:hypothetical protein
MYLPSDDEIDTMAEWYRRGANYEPAWAGGDLTLEAGLRLTIYYMQRPDLSLDSVARDLGVQRKNLDRAISELSEVITALSTFGQAYDSGNMTRYRSQNAARRAEVSLAKRIELEYAE